MRGVALLILMLAAAACAPPEPGTSTGPVQGRETVSITLPDGSVAYVEMHRQDGITTGRVSGSVDDAWRTLPDVYDEVGLSRDRLTVYDRGSHRIAAAGVRTSRLAGQRLSTFLRCGVGLGTPKADNGQTRITVETWLAVDDEGTRVMTRLEGMARDVGAGTSPIRCASNGRFESELLVLLQRRLLGAGTP
jgi:hypothetical protein